MTSDAPDDATETQEPQDATEETATDPAAETVVAKPPMRSAADWAAMKAWVRRELALEWRADPGRTCAPSRRR